MARNDRDQTDATDDRREVSISATDSTLTVVAGTKNPMEAINDLFRDNESVDPDDIDSLTVTMEIADDVPSVTEFVCGAQASTTDEQPDSIGGDNEQPNSTPTADEQSDSSRAEAQTAADGGRTMEKSMGNSNMDVVANTNTLEADREWKMASDECEKMEITPDTNYHIVLATIAGATSPMTSYELEEVLGDKMPVSSVTSSLTELYHGKCVQRREVPPGDSDVQYEYTISPHGVEQIRNNPDPSE